jgi:hypothetical protein
MDCSNGRKCHKARGEPLPANDHTTVFFLKPGQGPLGLEMRHIDCDWSASGLLGFLYAFGHLRPDLTFAQLLAQVFGVIPFIGSDDLRPFAGASRLASPKANGVQQRDDLGPLVPRGGHRRLARGIPAASVGLWMGSPLPLRPCATPSPPPLPGGKGPVDGAVLPLNHPIRLGNPEHAGSHHRERPIGLPTPDPALGGIFGCPLWPAREITPVAAGHQHLQ